MKKVSLWKNAASSPVRPKTGHSTIRGKPISQPIPIPSVLDDDFPIRNPGPDFPAPLAPTNQGPGTTALPTTPNHTDLTSREQDQYEHGSFSDTLPRPNTSPSGPGGSPGGHSDQSSPRSRPRESPQRRTNVNSTLRYSTVSAASTGQTGMSRETPQRKKSTLRAALGKLFGRRKKAISTATAPADDVLTGMDSTAQHRSTEPLAKDPSALTRPIDRGSEPKRSASLPITEFDRALRSHSVGPNDITAIESARNSLQAEPISRKRAATTSSRLLQIKRMAEWRGLSPRPASTHARGSRMLSGMELDGSNNLNDPNEIGMAITSDLTAHRRRSRSLSGLEDLDAHGADLRRRSDEIRYWRESYDPGYMSPLSSHAPGFERGDEGDENGGNFTTDGEVSTAMPASPATQQFGQQSQPRTPPQPFMFPSMAEMAGMKITHVATMETRINTLESRMHTLERVVNELCHQNPGFTMPEMDHAIPRRPSTAAGPVGGPSGLGIAVLDDQQPTASFTTATTSVPPIPTIYATANNGSHLSFGEAPTFTESLYPPTTLAAVAPPVPTTFLHNGRPISNSTVRGVASLPQLHAPDRSVESDDYSNLLALITAEQSARLALEAKVRTLSHRVDVLSGNDRGGPTTHSTPRRLNIPPIDMTRDQDVPGTAKSLGTFSAFDEDSSDEDAEGSGQEPKHHSLGVLSHGSGGSSGKSSSPPNAGGKPTIEIPSADDSSYSEVFETPREQMPTADSAAETHYGAFGEELKEDNGRRKAARTLSLSQLTLGKQGVVIGGQGDDIPPTPTVNQGVDF